MSKTHLNLSFFKKKQILITGANGYIGSSVAKVLAQAPCRLSLFTRQTGDITDKNIWRALLKNTDIVFHFAAQTSSNAANQKPMLDLETNVLPIINFIDTCTRYKYSPDFIFAGTVTEVGLTKQGNINEDRKDLPITIYDIHKLCVEKYLQYYCNQLKKRAVTLRLPNIYGPGPASSQPDRGIVNLMIKRALKNEPITVFGNGEYTRDYLYIDDVVTAFLVAAININKSKGNYYVLGTGVGHTIIQMANIVKNTVKRLTGKETKIIFTPFPENTLDIEFRNFTADSTAFQKTTSWEPTISLEEGIKKTVQYFLKAV